MRPTSHYLLNPAAEGRRDHGLGLSEVFRVQQHRGEEKGTVEREEKGTACRLLPPVFLCSISLSSHQAPLASLRQFFNIHLPCPLYFIGRSFRDRLNLPIDLVVGGSFQLFKSAFC
jgi:hypothetical protein